MKIAQVSPYDYAYPGGVNTHISHLALQLADMGHEVKILAPCSNKKAFPIPEGIIPLGKTIPWIANGSVARLTISWWLLPKIKSILEEEQFDIIHFHEPLFPSLPWMVIPQSQSLNIATFHAYYRYSVGYWFWKPLCTRFYKKLHGKIAVSKAAREFVSSHFPGEYHIIPHGIDLNHFSSEVDPMPDLHDGKLNILFVSRLEERKGVRYLLEAYDGIKKRMPESRLIIVGPGKKARYEAWAKAQKLEDIIFAGYVSSADLARYYEAADIFCIPAVGQESFGIVLLEAMSAGKPIVATNIAGYAAVVDHGVDGLLVPPKNVESLERAILNLLNDPELRQQMGKRGRAKAEKHSWEQITQRTMDYYMEVMERKISNGGKL